MACSDCNNPINSQDESYSLKCKKHIVCAECLEKRARPTENSGNLLTCSQCTRIVPVGASCSDTPKIKPVSVTSNSYKDALLKQSPRTSTASPKKSPTRAMKYVLDSPGIWIYVDDSNLWISAKILQAKLKRFKTGEDHRVRIDIGKLTDVLADRRSVSQGFLYGSEPPPIDSVWEKIQSKGWEVDREKRSRITGKEKKVDTKLVADVTEKAITTPFDQRSTIVLVTGDADALPAIEKVLKYEGWTVEVYMWQQSLSSEIKRYADDHADVTVHPLDQYINRVTFTNFKFNIKDPRLKSKLNAFGVVFTMKCHAFRIRHVPDYEWREQLESIAQWPFQYYWFKSERKESLSENPSNDLVVVFQEDSTAGRFDVGNFIELIKSEPFLAIDDVQTYRQFISNKFGTLDCIGSYSVDQIENAEINTDDDHNLWDVVNKVHIRKRQQYSELCCFKYNCIHGKKCPYKHTPKEKEFFSQNNGSGFPLRKVKSCNFLPNCAKAKEACLYAHGVEDAWCLICRNEGHFTDNCPTKQAHAKN